MRFQPGGSGNPDLWVTTRENDSDTFGPPVNLGPTVNSGSLEGMPTLPADVSTVFFTSNRPGGMGNFDLWQAPSIASSDFDEDGDVDLADYLSFSDCVSGPGVEPTGDCCEGSGGRRGGRVPCNAPADLDEDGDVDLADLVLFQADFTGSR